nr:hypothetical protein [Tanacetum cinerariifolium]
MDTELPSTEVIQPPSVQVEVQEDKPIEEPSKLRLPTLNDTKMVLELADRTISKPMGRPFLSTAHAIINVHEREIILRQDQQSLIFQCGDILSIKKVEQINKIDFINAGGIDFESEEIENFLNDNSIPFGVEDSPFNMEEDILFLESLLREDPIPPHLIIPNQIELLIEEPKHSFKMGYEHFNTNLVTNDVVESSTKNLIPIPYECVVVSENGSKSIEPVNDNSSTISNPLFDNENINFDEINSLVEFNSDESTSNHDIMNIDNLDEFYRPFIPIHILEEERIRREHADYINRMEMLFTINPRPHQPTNNHTNVESFSSLPIPIQESDSHQEEIDIVSITDDVLPPRVENDDSDKEVDAVDALRVYNFIQNSKHEYSKSEDTIFDPVEMSRDVLTVVSTMRIPLLYRGEYSQWVERFMNYLEEQIDGEAMINSIKSDDQLLHRVTQVSIAGTTSTKQPPLKDKSMCNKTAKDLWDALATHMLGSEYGEQDRKLTV